VPKRLLLVDDEPDVTQILAIALRKYGYDVTAYNDPHKALVDFKKGAYDIVILDYKMPALDGFELYEEMVVIDNKPKFCFLSAAGYLPKAGKTAKPKLKEAHFIHKPITAKDLAYRLEVILNSN